MGLEKLMIPIEMNLLLIMTIILQIKEIQLAILKRMKELGLINDSESLQTQVKRFRKRYSSLSLNRKNINDINDLNSSQSEILSMIFTIGRRIYTHNTEKKLMQQRKIKQQQQQVQRAYQVIKTTIPPQKTQTNIQKLELQVLGILRRIERKNVLMKQMQHLNDQKAELLYSDAITKACNQLKIKNKQFSYEKEELMKILQKDRLGKIRKQKCQIVKQIMQMTKQKVNMICSMKIQCQKDIQACKIMFKGYDHLLKQRIQALKTQLDQQINKIQQEFNLKVNKLRVRQQLLCKEGLQIQQKRVQQLKKEQLKYVQMIQALERNNSSKKAKEMDKNNKRTSMFPNINLNKLDKPKPF